MILEVPDDTSHYTLLKWRLRQLLLFCPAVCRSWSYQRCVGALAHPPCPSWGSILRIRLAPLNIFNPRARDCRNVENCECCLVVRESGPSLRFPNSDEIIGLCNPLGPRNSEPTELNISALRAFGENEKWRDLIPRPCMELVEHPL